MGCGRRWRRHAATDVRLIAADNDPKLAEKQRKAEEEKRKAEERRKKQQEAREQLAKEEAEFKAKGAATTKVTLAERARDREAERRRLEAEREKRALDDAKVVYVDPAAPIPENTNRSVEVAVDARSLDAALAQLDLDASSADTSSTSDNPTKRMRAAYAAFEEKNLQRLRDENPSLRLQQVKQLLWDEWQKDDSNPVRQQKLQEEAARLADKRAFKAGQ